VPCHGKNTFSHQEGFQICESETLIPLLKIRFFNLVEKSNCATNLVVKATFLLKYTEIWYVSSSYSFAFVGHRVAPNFPSDG